MRRLLVRGPVGARRRSTPSGPAQPHASRFRGRKYDAIIVDVGLPDGSGLDLIELARERCPGVVVLVLTGSTEHAVIDRTLEAGARYLLKPCHAKHLAIVAAEALVTPDRRRAADEDHRSSAGRRITPSASPEVELLALGAEGVPRSEFSERRNVRPDTIRKQIHAAARRRPGTTPSRAPSTACSGRPSRSRRDGRCGGASE